MSSTRAFARLSTLPVSEPPSFWVAIVNDPRYRDDRRRDCLVAFFTRHMPPGTRLNRFHEISGTSGWFNTNNLYTWHAGGPKGFTETNGLPYRFQPDLLLSPGTNGDPMPMASFG